MITRMQDSTSYKGRDGKLYRIPMWQKEGFLELPTLELSTGKETLYRVWGGEAKEFGRFFSLLSYAKRSEAERHSHIMGFGNGVLHQTRFRILEGVPIWVGRVHPGDKATFFGSIAGSQIFVDFEYLNTSVFRVAEVTIKDDMKGAFVINNPDRGQLNS